MPRSGGEPHASGWIALGCCLALALFGARVVADGLQIAEATGRLERQSLSLMRVGHAAFPDTPAAGERPPRARLANAIELTRRAAQEPFGPERDALLGKADAALAPVLATRLVWGEAQVAAAFLAVQRRDDVAALAAYRKSYADGPFIRHAAEWRIAFGFANWARLDESTQECVIREALTLALIDPPSRRAVFALARRSDAYASLAARWRLIRAEQSAIGR